MSKKKPEIAFADATAIEALSSYVDEVLAAVAEATKQPGARHAFVSDQSHIGDFLDGERTGKTMAHPFEPGQEIECVTYDTSKNRRIVAQIARKLGVKVSMDDCVYEVAIRVRGPSS